MYCPIAYFCVWLDCVLAQVVVFDPCCYQAFYGPDFLHFSQLSRSVLLCTHDCSSSQTHCYGFCSAWCADFCNSLAVSQTFTFKQTAYKTMCIHYFWKHCLHPHYKKSVWLHTCPFTSFVLMFQNCMGRKCGYSLVVWTWLAEGAFHLRHTDNTPWTELPVLKQILRLK
jgi:hypothetical protein